MGVGGPIHFNAFHDSPGNFSASGFTASGGPTLLGVIPGTQVQQLFLRMNVFIEAVGFGITAGTVMALGAVGFTVQFGISNVPNITYGALMTLAAYLVMRCSAWAWGCGPRWPSRRPGSRWCRRASTGC